jgi:hypothetical protein
LEFFERKEKQAEGHNHVEMTEEHSYPRHLEQVRDRDEAHQGNQAEEPTARRDA